MASLEKNESLAGEKILIPPDTIDLTNLGFPPPGLTISKTTSSDTLERQILRFAKSMTPVIKTETDVTINGKTYTIELELGKGGYGSVYKVKHEDTYYALKMQKFYVDESANTDEYDDMLYDMFNEAIVNYILQTLDPDSIMHIYAFGLDDEYSYMIIEYVDGLTMNETLHRGFISFDSSMYQICSYLKNVAEILNMLQDPLGFTHGDLHSENIMILSGSNKIKLIDFGFSRINFHNCHIICNTYNTKAHKGKDISILLYDLLSRYKIENFSSENAKSLFTKYRNILTDTNFHVKNTDILYAKLNRDDNLKANPENVLADLNDCEEAKNVPATGGSRKIGGFRRNNSRIASRRPNRPSKNTSRKLKTPSIESLRTEISPEDIIHKYCSKYSVATLQDVLLQSHVDHIKKYSSLIAELYLGEKNKSLQLDLFKTLLFFDSSFKPGAFENFCDNYKKAKPNERLFMIYGNDRSLKKNHYKIHWNAIGKWL